MEPDSNWLSMEKVQKEMEFFRLYRALHNMMREGIEQGLRQMGVDLTSSQLDVLICIAQGGGRPVNQKDIEEELHLSNPTVTGILKRMERKGFISRTVGSRDRRYKEVRLTEKCARLGDRLHPSALDHLEALFRGITREEFDTLNRLLRQLLENANQISPEKPCIEPAACPLVGAASAANG